MASGEIITVATVWLSLAGYAVGMVTFCLARRMDRLARAAWTLGCAGMLAHTASAFHFYHDWSHASAFADTASQTEALFGLYWGGGVFVNYTLLIAWILDCAWWWRGLPGYRHRPKALVWLWNCFLLFIVFNATVVFETGWTRGIGLVLCIGICCLWWCKARRT